MRGAAALLDLVAVGAPDEKLVARLRSLLGRPDDVEHPLDVGAPSADVARALIELVPDALAHHRAAGIPLPVTVETLADVGRKHRLYGAAAVTAWMLELLRGDVVSVGRLQVSMRDVPPGHRLHIPETGPLRPDDVDAALRRAREITGASTFACTSWLLDPRLREALPGSNIVAFASRFRIVDDVAGSSAASDDAARFVFRRSVADVIDPALPVSSRLERVVADTLRAGHDWRMPTGVVTVR